MTEPFYADRWLSVYGGDCRAVLTELPEGLAQVVVTSPPYWALRDYQVEPTVWGGDPAHPHEWQEEYRLRSRSGSRLGSTLEGAGPKVRIDSGSRLCSCGAWLGQLGLEPTPDLYVAHMVEVFRAVARVLRDDGTLWLNLGDTYATGGGRVGERPGGGSRGDRWLFTSVRTSPNRLPIPGLKPKDLVGIPWRVALALQADGWYLRRDVVWWKPNPTPENVFDRPTCDHEFVFLLSKRRRYRYDRNAVRVTGTSGPADVRKMVEAKERIGGLTKVADDPLMKASALTNIGRKRSVGSPERLLRTVWPIATQSYPGAHFATFPERLARIPITAASRPGDVILDPFAGSGTVGLAAQALDRRAVLIDANPDYVRQAIRRASRVFGYGGPPIREDEDPPDDSIWSLVEEVSG